MTKLSVRLSSESLVELDGWAASLGVDRSRVARSFARRGWGRGPSNGESGERVNISVPDDWSVDGEVDSAGMRAGILAGLEVARRVGVVHPVTGAVVGGAPAPPGMTPAGFPWSGRLLRCDECGVAGAEKVMRLHVC